MTIYGGHLAKAASNATAYLRQPDQALLPVTGLTGIIIDFGQEED